MADHEPESRPTTAYGPHDAPSPSAALDPAVAHDVAADYGAKFGQRVEPVEGQAEESEASQGALDNELPPLPETSDDELSIAEPPTGLSTGLEHGSDDASALLERHTRRGLMDMESSFLPEPEGQSQGVAKGADDTYLFAGSPGRTERKIPSPRDKQKKGKKSIADIIRESVAARASREDEQPMSPESLRDAGQSLGMAHSPEQEDLASRESTASVDLPSSPAAEAAKRTVARVSILTPDAAESTGDGVAQTSMRKGHQRQDSGDTITGDERSSPEASFTSPSREDHTRSTLSSMSSRLLKKPTFLSHRHASQGSATSSTTIGSAASDNSDNTIGADFAIQTGGAAPGSGSVNPKLSMSRLPSFGNVSVSSAEGSLNGTSTSPWKASRATSGELFTLKEERALSPETPRPGTSGRSNPTETVLAQHVQNIRVPETIAKEYREKFGIMSINRLDMGTLSSFKDSRRGNLTLKEQNSKIDKLTKENFDLKLKIHFLDQALQNRSDEGVKEMISKNVQLQTDLANEKKESQSLRKKVRELEQKLKDQEAARNKPQARPLSPQSDRSEKMADLEEEVIFLRETIQEHEVEIERLREETMDKEIQTRKLADYVKVMSEERRVSEDTGAEETIDMWKDLLQAETARREQADEDAERLREENNRLREQVTLTNNVHNVRNIYQIRKSHTSNSYGRPDSRGAGSVVGGEIINGEGRADSTASTLVDQLKHENAELRRDLSAQTSMLTSRNRERERLQQEIEDLKLNQRRHAGDHSAVRSVAGDSIFERSVSRAHNRAESRLSGNTRITQLSDAERDDYERRYAAVRDELAQIKMVNQDLERELNAHLDILQSAEAENKALQEDKNLNLEDLKALQAERDEAIALVETLEEEEEKLRQEALDEIEQLEQELERRQQDFEALQQEMKTISEHVVRLEDELNASRRKEEQLEQRLEETQKELVRNAGELRDTQSKNERLDVQLESSQSEISFLREEQEADKIKIGELEASLSASQATLQEEQERIAEERQQRDVVDSQEKEEVQKMLDVLNQENARYREEGRRWRKNMEGKEVEAKQWKERLETLESNLREALGDLNGTRSSILKDVTKLTRDLEHTVSALEHCQSELSERDRILRARDALLESAGLESRKLSELLEKERAGRRTDRNHFEQIQRSQQSLTRTIQQSDQRVGQVESARRLEKRKWEQTEQNLVRELGERNALLNTVWTRLSTLCGAEFLQRNSLVNKELVSVDVIARNLPGFSKNVTLAIKTVEVIINGFRSRIREVERNLFKDFQTLERAMDVRTKRIDHLEKSLEQQTRERAEHPGIDGSWDPRKSLYRGSSKAHASATRDELHKLKAENKLLKAEIQIHQTRSSSKHSPSKHSAKESIDSITSSSSVIAGSAPKQVPGTPSRGLSSSRTRASLPLTRHHSDTISTATATTRTVSLPPPPSETPGSPSQPSPAAQGTMQNTTPAYPANTTLLPLHPSEQRWIHRLKELERRLKQEREARLLDRSGARKRLEELGGERDELRELLERERERAGRGRSLQREGDAVTGAREGSAA